LWRGASLARRTLFNFLLYLEFLGLVWGVSLVSSFGAGRALGIIGSVLVVFDLVLGAVGLYTFLFTIAGLILVVASLHYISLVYGERRVFRYAVVAVAVFLLALILVLLLVALTLGFAFLSILLGPLGALPAMGSLVLLLIVSLLILLAAAPISALFWYLSLDALSRVSGVTLFKWAALLYAAGVALLILGVLTLIVLVGIIFLALSYISTLASWVLLAIAFYTLKPPQPQGLT